MTRSAPLRVAVLADTHGFLDPRIADRVAECDIAVHAGDIGGADVLLSLQPQDEVVAIRGNNDTPDHWADGEQHLLETLPREARVTLPGGDLVLLHGDDGGSLAERHRRYRRRFPDARAVVYGHSHRQLVDQAADPWLLNPGAAGRTRTHGGPGCLILGCRPDGWTLERLVFEPRRYRTNRRREAPDTHSADEPD